MSKNFLNAVKEETNITKTTNGALTHRTSKSYVLDYFAQGSALRSASKDFKLELLTKSLGENELLTMKALFYSRDVRGGQGERQTFKELIAYLAENHPDLVKANIELIAFFGRWDDLYALFGTRLEKDAIEVMKKQLDEDVNSENPSLLAKWMHSENASSKQGIALARTFMKAVSWSPRKYRKTLSAIRKTISLVETKLTEKEYSAIDYSKLPSKAGIKYRKAFKKNDEERYTEFLEKAVNGEVKVNAATLFPYDIIGKFFENSDWGGVKTLPLEETKLLEAAWANLPDYIKNSKKSILPVIDTSGSMTCDKGWPIKCAIALGMYCAERNAGPFKNHFLSFNDRTQLIEITGKKLNEKVANIMRAPWGGSTNVQSTFDLILKTAKDNNLSQEDLPERVAIISDMQFNCCRNVSQTVFQNIKNDFAAAGYTMPKLIFWYVNAEANNIPMTMNEAGVQLVSGASPSLFEALLEDEFLGAYELMLKVLTKERYDCITV